MSEMTSGEIEYAERIAEHLRDRRRQAEATERRAKALAGPHGAEILELEGRAEFFFGRMEEAMRDAIDEYRTLDRQEKEIFDDAARQRDAALAKAASLIRVY
jgi:predicted urease superfamily metal-dependent hydrolase